MERLARWRSRRQARSSIPVHKPVSFHVNLPRKASRATAVKSSALTASSWAMNSYFRCKKNYNYSSPLLPMELVYAKPDDWLMTWVSSRSRLNDVLSQKPWCCFAESIPHTQPKVHCVKAVRSAVIPLLRLPSHSLDFVSISVKKWIKYIHSGGSTLPM